MRLTGWLGIAWDPMGVNNGPCALAGESAQISRPVGLRSRCERTLECTPTALATRAGSNDQSVRHFEDTSVSQNTSSHIGR